MPPEQTEFEKITAIKTALKKAADRQAATLAKAQPNSSESGKTIKIPYKDISNTVDEWLRATSLGVKLTPDAREGRLKRLHNVTQEEGFEIENIKGSVAMTEIKESLALTVSQAVQAAFKIEPPTQSDSFKSGGGIPSHSKSGRVIRGRNSIRGT